jgi:hypothetical protein
MEQQTQYIENRKYLTKWKNNLKMSYNLYRRNIATFACLDKTKLKENLANT